MQVSNTTVKNFTHYLNSSKLYSSYLDIFCCK